MAQKNGYFKSQLGNNDPHVLGQTIKLVNNRLVQINEQEIDSRMTEDECWQTSCKLKKLIAEENSSNKKDVRLKCAEVLRQLENIAVFDRKDPYDICAKREKQARNVGKTARADLFAVLAEFFAVKHEQKYEFELNHTTPVRNRERVDPMKLNDFIAKAKLNELHQEIILLPDVPFSDEI